jgi:nudix-type nucleoside diphosphatase (YffH/AdpP family)
MADDPTMPPTRLPDVRIIDSHMVYEGWLTLDVVVMESEIAGQTRIFRREVHDHGDGAAVLAFERHRRTAIMVRQYRAGAMMADGRGLLLEVIAGLVDPPEDPALTVTREALEEAGVHLTPPNLVSCCYASPGSLTEKVWLYLAEIDITQPRHEGGGVAGEHEAIEVIELPLARLADMADRGKIADMKTLLLIEALRRREPALFA